MTAYSAHVQPGRTTPESSGWYPVWLGSAARPVVAYWNATDQRWFHDGLRVQGYAVGSWLGPDPLPERRVKE